MKLFLTAWCSLLTIIAVAQPGITDGSLAQAKQELSSSFFSALDFALVLALLLGSMGALRIYQNWQMGEKRIDAVVAAWFFAAIFMILSGPFLKALFGI
ncbi:DUF4134 domain-containing protein [Mucilaginibacter sp. HC2]|uniref:DUF4134 family protein n=1 Tax=Mucilaginibacter inviolabilis TaxID=2714892 RepID=UPI00140DEE11|nr:DUF4134 family protein [Mucilaginibacter inviolabilis]NHA03270.1 DUF4134 domain-containing protein [Mucilaginibacter inviolabilis]